MKRQKKGSPRFHFFSSDHYVNLLTSVQTLFSYFPCKLFFFLSTFTLPIGRMGQIRGDYLLLESYARRVNYQLAVLRLYCVSHHFPICSSIPFVDTNNIFVVLLTKERFTSVTTSVTIPSSMMHLLYERILINV